jgi:3',5'-cyclic AMP phosphodiesterase CpdA
MTPKTRIAVISDLHIGLKSIALDLCPHDLAPEQKIGRTSNFLHLFHEHVTSSEFKNRGPIDVLCITGDISDRADPKEFELANSVIGEIAKSLGVQSNEIFYVPGNHDVHWPVMNLDPAEFWKGYRYAPLLQPGLLFHSQIDMAAVGSYHEIPHFAAWISDPNKIMIGVNSAAFDSPQPEHGKHHGLIHQKTIDDLKIFLQNLPTTSPEQLRICLLHHHPIAYSDPRPNEPDFSAAANAEHLFQLLSEHRFDLIIHGHKHVPHITYRAQITNGHPIMVLGAGSFSARLDSQWVGTAQNQFHVIDIAGRNPSTHGIYGNVSTWDFVNGAWMGSHSRNGICAIENFGALSTPQEITTAINDYVDAEIKAKKFCKWKTLEEHVPDLAHVNTKIAFDTFSAIGKSKGLQTFGELDAPNRGWIVMADV